MATRNPIFQTNIDELPERDVAAHFYEVFDEIAQGAAARDQQRQLAYEAVEALKNAGFGRLRVPRALGGLGVSHRTLYEILIRLGAADANLPQIWRAHIGFIERLQFEIEPALAEPWLRLAAQGAMYGNATTEPGDGPLGKPLTQLQKSDDGSAQLRLSGVKYYSTGTLYADYIVVSTQPVTGHDPQWRSVAVVRRDAAGVSCEDDWDGFGQRLSASGTTRFENVPVSNGDVLRYRADLPTPLPTVLQTTHLATLAGIASAIVKDAATFVKQRQRVYSHGGGQVLAADDPLVQQVIGELAAAAFSAAANVQAVALKLEAIDQLHAASGKISDEALIDLELSTSGAQITIVETVTRAATRLFDVGGASALQADKVLDRHWRNARTLSSHNPAIYKSRIVGDYLVNGTKPSFYWSVGRPKTQTSTQDATKATEHF